MDRDGYPDSTSQRPQHREDHRHGRHLAATNRPSYFAFNIS
jgi:hypothetical protein